MSNLIPVVETIRSGPVADPDSTEFDVVIGHVERSAIEAVVREQVSLETLRWVFQAALIARESDGSMEAFVAALSGMIPARMSVSEIEAAAQETLKRAEELHAGRPRDIPEGVPDSESDERVSWLNEQVREMAELFPGFVVVRKTYDYAQWRGTLQPREKGLTYIVRVTAFAHSARDPIVDVLDPAPSADAPHRYADGRLCLYYPPDGTWSDNRSVARTIVGLTAVWLACYELWQATGQWYAPEAPHEHEETAKTPAKNGAENGRDPETIPAEPVRELIARMEVQAEGGYPRTVVYACDVVAALRELLPPRKAHGTVAAHLEEQMQTSGFKREYEASGDGRPEDCGERPGCRACGLGCDEEEDASAPDESELRKAVRMLILDLTNGVNRNTTLLSLMQDSEAWAEVVAILEAHD